MSCSKNETWLICCLEIIACVSVCAGISVVVVVVYFGACVCCITIVCFMLKIRYWAASCWGSNVTRAENLEVRCVCFSNTLCTHTNFRPIRNILELFVPTINLLWGRFIFSSVLHWRSYSWIIFVFIFFEPVALAQVWKTRASQRVGLRFADRGLTGVSVLSCLCLLLGHCVATTVESGWFNYVPAFCPNVSPEAE